MPALATIGLLEALLIAFVIVLLFASAKIPQVMRGMGAGIHEFKKGIKEGQGNAAKPADTK